MYLGVEHDPDVLAAGGGSLTDAGHGSTVRLVVAVGEIETAEAQTGVHELCRPCGGAEPSPKAESCSEARTAKQHEGSGRGTRVTH